MPDQSIRRLIAALESEDRLARVQRPVDPERDLAAVGMKLLAERGKAGLFEAVLGATGWQVATQLLAGRAQWASALGIPEATLLAALRDRMRHPVAPSTVAASVGGSKGTVETLPIPRGNERDTGGQLVAVAIAVDPDTGRECLSLTRHHRVAPGRLSITGLSPVMERLHRRHRDAGAKMPVALVVGGAPALYLAAALGGWRAADLALAGGLAGSPIEIVRHGILPIPVDAELIVTGEISATETAAATLASPFGTYAEAATLPVLAVSEAVHRPAPVLYAMQTGAGGDLAATLCLAAEILVAEHIRNIEGGIDVLDIRCPAVAGGQVVIIKLRGRMEGQTKTALMGALSGPTNWLKLAIAVDEDVDAADLRDVFWSVASRTHAEIDVGMIDGMRAHPLDLAAPLDGAGPERIGTRWFIDSTMPPLSQGKRRDDFARAIPKNLSETDLAPFLPKL
jgi:UbiD family decarboxylase